MPATKLHDLLDRHDIPYETHTHLRAVTAQHLAEVAGVSGHEVAKPVLLNVRGQLAMLVLPATELVDLQRASDALGHNEVRLASEDEFVDLFDDCEPGAEPPFGMLYGLPTFLDHRLRSRPQLVCRDGTHTRSIRLATADYLDLVQPELVDVGLTPA